jgi:hypothetical protein
MVWVFVNVIQDEKKVLQTRLVNDAPPFAEESCTQGTAHCKKKPKK